MMRPQPTIIEDLKCRAKYAFKEMTMKKTNICILIIISIWLLPVMAGADNFDGSKELICSVMDIVECQPGGKCQQVTAEEVGIPYFFYISFKDKKISSTHADGSKRVTDIERFEKVDNKVIIQGAEDGVEDVRDGVGWSAAIAEDTGKMVLTASGDDVGFVVFGACTIP
jgi:6-phosphogluconate dehydrogenase